uniref:Uncharacterized protein n=1 Tax=Clandestinovirus TaxID=2831644 RepID=A0A8F8KLK1_9VIRU|nr:hypothetical protein KOM_12_72 [Clandestinovirus]
MSNSQFVVPDRVYFPVFQHPLHPAVFAVTDQGTKLYFSIEGRVFKRVTGESGNIDWQLEFDIDTSSLFLKLVWVPLSKGIELQGSTENPGYPHQQFIEADPIYRVFTRQTIDGILMYVFTILLPNGSVMAYQSNSTRLVPQPLFVQNDGNGVYTIDGQYHLTINGIGQSEKTQWVLGGHVPKDMTPELVGLFGLGHLVRTTVECEILAGVFSTENQDDWSEYIGCAELRNDPIQIQYANQGGI